MVNHHIILDIAQAEQHFWSPQLNFRIEEDEDDASKTVIAGIIGPKPTVWTLFVFIYFTVGMAGFVMSSYAISLKMMGEHSNFIWGLPIAILFMLTAYKAGKVGEKLGEDQVELLKGYVRDAINEQHYLPVA